MLCVMCPVVCYVIWDMCWVLGVLCYVLCVVWCVMSYVICVMCVVCYVLCFMCSVTFCSLLVLRIWWYSYTKTVFSSSKWFCFSYSHHLSSWQCIDNEQKTLHSRKDQWTNQKYQNLGGSDQQMQRLEETELRKADCTFGVNFHIHCSFQYIVRHDLTFVPDLFRECLQPRKDVTISTTKIKAKSITTKSGPLK